MQISKDISLRLTFVVPLIVSELLITRSTLLVAAVILLMFLEGRLRVENLVAIAALVREQTMFLLFVGVERFNSRTKGIAHHTVTPLQRLTGQKGMFF